MTCEVGAPEQLRVDMTNAVHIHSWRHPDVNLRPAPQGGFQLSTSALLPMATFLPCMLVWDSGNPPPLLEASWIEVDGITLQDLDVSQIVWGY